MNYKSIKNKGIKTPTHSSNPMIAMILIGVSVTSATPLPVQTETTTDMRPKNFIESKKFKTEHNDIFIGLYKDNKTNNYRIWVDCYTQRLMSYEKMNGYITEYNENEYKIEDTFGYHVQSFNFNNIYVKHVIGTHIEDGGALADENVCRYVSELISKYTINIKPQYHKYIMKMAKDGNIEYKLEKYNNKYRIAKNNPMYFGKEMAVWEIETSKGIFRVKIYNADKNDSNFEVISIENLKLRGPEIKVEEIIAANSHIFNKADKLCTLERYQINAHHDMAGDIVIENKELWEFIYKLMSTKQCNNASSGKEIHFYHSSIMKCGIIDPGEDPLKH